MTVLTQVGQADDPPVSSSRLVRLIDSARLSFSLSATLALKLRSQCIHCFHCVCTACTGRRLAQLNSKMARPVPTKLETAELAGASTALPPVIDSSSSSLRLRRRRHRQAETAIWWLFSTVSSFLPDERLNARSAKTHNAICQQSIKSISPD